MPLFSILRRPGPSQLITSWEDLDRLEGDWDRLWQADSRTRGRCYSYRWVREHVLLSDRRGVPSVPWCVALRDQSGRVTGIAPFLIEKGRRRRLRSLPELVEWNHCLLHEGPVDALAREILHHFDRNRMDGLRMRGVLRSSALELAQAWGGSWRCSVQRISQAEGNGIAGTTYWDRKAITISGTWEEFLRSRGGNYRSSLKRAMKRTSQAGKVRFWRHSAGRQICGDPLTNDDILAALRPIEERAWQEERHFAPGGDGSMKLDVLRRQGQLELSLLYLDEKPISYIFGCAAGRVSTLNYLAFEPAHNDLSPGVVTLAELLRTSYEERHLDEINLRGSQHRYKAQLADVTESAFVVELVGLSPRGMLSALARRVRPGHRTTGPAALEALRSPEPLGEPGDGVEERARVVLPHQRQKAQA